MSSMLEQYEQATSTNYHQHQHTSGENLQISSGYVTVHLQQETPMFQRQKMNLNPSDTITHFATANDILVLAMANQKLFRIDLKQPNASEEIPFGKYIQPNMKLNNIFIDPLGSHLIMSFFSKTNSELLYLHTKSSKPKVITKAKNTEVTEVGWNYENTSENMTGPILFGTSKGLIIESDIAADGDKMFQSGIEQYWKQVFDIGKGKDVPITGISFHRLSDTSKWYIFITTPKRLYQFYGNINGEDRPLLQSVFNDYLNRIENNFLEVSYPTSQSQPTSKLQLYLPKGRKNPLSIAWQMDSDIRYGQLDSIFDSKTSVSDIKDILSNDAFSDEGTEKQKLVSFVMTEFHALLIYKNHAKAICLLNKELVFEEKFPEAAGNLINITMDPLQHTVWAVTNKTIFRYKITREERNIWNIYMDKNEFLLAKKYCDKNPAYLDQINVKEAEMWFKHGDYIHSAEIFAETQSTFEGVCRKFLEIDEFEALQVYLERKLQSLKPQEMIQMTMLIVWLFEIYLTQMSSFSSTDSSDKRIKKQKKFEEFIMSPKVNECIKRHKLVFYDLLASHGDKENLLKLTVINKDFENVVRQNIFKKSYKEALDVLKAQGKNNLFYQFVPVLLQEIPTETVNVLIEQGKKLNPSKLLPALLSCDADKKHTTEMIRYLEFCTRFMMCNDRAIHNYLLSLYAAHEEHKLLPYLQSQGRISMIHYDVHYALRLCREKNLTDACIHLSRLLELWESAVELALPVDVEKAKQIANMPDDAVMKKKLWLKIAHYVISKNEKIEEAMKFLKECNLIKIEDILPFFSDFLTIDHFREPICNSLQEYNQQYQDFHEEMEEATKSANMVRSNIQTYRNHCTNINVSEVCVLCEITLLLRPFCLFPCGHKFHTDCLQNELIPLLGPAKSNRLQELQRLMQSTSTPESQERIKNDIDNIIAADCLYCGEFMIQAIDTPFIPDDKWDQVIKEWE